MKETNINYKLLKSSKEAYLNYNLIYIHYFFNTKPFIIFINYKQFKNKEMYHLKNELYELKIHSKILLKTEKKKIFNSYFSFLGGDLFCIFISDINMFKKCCNILFLKKIKYFYAYNKKISNLVHNNEILDLLGGNVFITIHFIIVKLIWNIIILLLYFILILIKYINI